MAISKRIFGYTKNKEPVTLYTITAKNGSSASIMDYGAAIVSLRFPDREGKLLECCLGYDDFSYYEESDDCHGAVVGPVCGRIRGARFSLSGRDYPLLANDGENHLHSAGAAFHRKVFSLERMTENSITLMTLSPDGEGGYPGNLSVSVTYALEEPDRLTLSFAAQTDRKTPVSLTNHSYFRLSDEADILNHTLQLDASRITECGPGNIPTGRLLDVKGTVFDFTLPKKLGQDIKKEEPSLLLFGGYDHNFCIDGSGLRHLGTLSSDRSGIRLSICSDLPGLQVYTGNYLSPLPSHGGRLIGPRSGIALEPQYWPDAMHHEGFPSILLAPGEVWNHRVEYRFTTF